METRPPGKSKSREIVERAAEAGAGSVPVVGAALAVALVTALNWKLNERRDDWFESLARRVGELGDRVDGYDVDALADNPRFVDAVVSAARTVEHTHQEEKLEALRNAVLNSAMPGAPDADTQALFLGLVDRFTASHLRLLTLWDDPPGWFARFGLAAPQNIMAGGRTLTVEAGLPEMRGRQGFYLQVAADLTAAGMMNASLTGMVSGPSLLDRLTTEFGRQFAEFISPPRL